MSLAAIYENGVLRLLEPLHLPEGARVEVLVVDQSAQEQSAIENLVKSSEMFSSTQVADILAQIAALPETPHPDGRTDISINHDEILYPKAP